MVAERTRSSAPPAAGWGLRWRRTEPLRRRLALGALSGSALSLVLALVDALWVRRATTVPPELSVTLAATAGAIAPLALLLGMFVGVVSWLVHPRVEPSLRDLLARLREFGAGRPADVAAFVPLSALALFLWATSSAQLARVVLGLDITPLLCGAVVATASVALGAVLTFGVLALTPALRHRLAAWSGRWKWCTDPAATLLGACLLVVVLVVYGVLRGSVSGEGGFFGIYGILKRQELDLRAPAMLLVLAIACYLAPPRLRWLKPYQAWLFALVPLGFTVYAAGALNRELDLGAAIERSAPLAARPLGLLRRVSDRDRDGAGAYFGGGDCADRDPAIGPHADDVPDNGVDEDCSGSDLTLTGIAAEPTASAAPVSPSKLPERGNVVLITIDTLRYDVGFMGYKRNITPNLDALAKRSVVFDRAYALASYTGKSVGPMLIGKYGSETHRNWGHFNKFTEADVFVAQRIQKGGVRTYSVQGHQYFGQWGGLERGFDVIDMSAAPKAIKWETDVSVTSDKLSDAAMEQLKKVGDKDRFFMWVHYTDPHADYLRHEDIESFGSNARALYDGEVAFTDKHVGRLLDFLQKQSWANRTSIIVTSDHGEAFGENGMWRHGFELWEVLVRVPLCIYVPGAPPKRIAPRRSLIDLTPTILELLRLPIPKEELSGQSLVPDIFHDKQPPARDILIDMPAGPYNESRRARVRA